MVAARETITFDVHDAQIAKMLTDTVGNPAPTYGPWIDVPGIQQVTVEPEFVTSELKGDARTLDRRGRTSAMNINVTYGVLSLPVLEVLFGGAISDTASPESVAWLLKGANSTPYFKFAFAVNDVSLGLGSLVVVGMKVQATGGSLFDQSTDNYGSRSFQAACIPTLSNDELFQVNMFSSLTPIHT